MRHLPPEALLEKELGKRLLTGIGLECSPTEHLGFSGKNVDATETRCVVDGKESCEFVVGKNARVTREWE